MLTRLAVGLLGLAILMPSLIWGGELAVQIIVTLALLVGLDEYSRMAAPDAHWRSLGVLMLSGGLLYAALVWGTLASIVGSLALGTVIVLISTLFLQKDTPRAADTAARLTLGMLYLPVFMGSLVWVRRFDGGLFWLLIVLGAAWMGDTGAYFSGRALGRHKLFVRISPKKTWEGAIGGMVFSVGWTCFVKAMWLPDLPWGHAIALGALLDWAGVLGDLVESMFKRSFGVKDSGRIMPGHGGILDRIDSVVMIAPIAWVYVTVFGLA